jgi:hypothetical protein
VYFPYLITSGIRLTLPAENLMGVHICRMEWKPTCQERITWFKSFYFRQSTKDQNPFIVPFLPSSLLE